MKKSLFITTVALFVSASAFAQGYVNYSFPTRTIWDEFTTPGVGTTDTGVAFALYFAAAGTSDPLSAVAGSSSQYGQRGGSPNSQVATNGVSSVNVANINSILTGAGFTLAATSGTADVGTTGASGNSLMGQQVIDNWAAGATKEVIIVGWNASGAAAALTGGTYTAIGWSNPFNYISGTSASDPNGTIQISSAGYGNQFGVATVSAVPEPGTIALAALGGASLLLFRRRK